MLSLRKLFQLMIKYISKTFPKALILKRSTPNEQPLSYNALYIASVKKKGKIQFLSKEVLYLGWKKHYLSAYFGTVMAQLYS